MGTINAEWHKANRMPKNASAAQRAKWHYEHAMHCNCRAITPSIAALLKAQGFDLPHPNRPPG